MNTTVKQEHAYYHYCHIAASGKSDSLTSGKAIHALLSDRKPPIVL